MMFIRCWLSLPLWGSVLVPCFVDNCFVYFLDLQTSCSGRESWLLYFFVFLVSCNCFCSVALPHSAVGRSAVYACGIS